MKSLRLAAGLVLCALMVGALGAARPALAVTLANCTGTQLVPALGDATVNQGVGNYQFLVRGKETLVKFFLKTPTACTLTNSQSITIQRATLSVDNGTAQFGPISAFQSFAANPAVASTLSTNSPADPIFVVPSADLTPGTGDSTFTPTFTATVTYSMVNGKTVTANQTATFTKTGVTFDKKTNALRVLVVPMGDGTPGVLANTQYTGTDQTTTQNGFSALSRIFPVPSGIADITGTTGGIRYVIDLAALVNLRAVAATYDSNGKFCGQSGNFDGIKAQLAQFMQSWNSVSTNPPVDRVLGVVGNSISDGADFGCADGMASVVSPEAWVRAIPDVPATSKTAAQPSRTGSLMAMELAHTWGSEPDSSFHSPNVSADTTAPGRAYNVTTRSFLGTNRSVMKYSWSSAPPWDDTLTLLEPDDYSFDRCALGGTVSGVADCTNVNTTTGTNFGVAAQGPFIVSGTINTSASPETADIVQSGFLPSQTIGAQADSQYRYVRRNTTTQALETNLGFHVSFINSLHGNGGAENSDPQTQQGLFSFALPDNASLDYANDPADVQIWKVAQANANSTYNPSEAAGDVLLYDKQQQAQPPTLTNITIGAAAQPSNYSNTPLINERAPALTDNGQWVAWTQFNSDPAIDADGIQIAPASDHSKAVFVPTPLGGTPSAPTGADAENPTWNPAGTAIAYDVGGNIYTQTVNVSGATPTFGAPVLVYNQAVGEFTWPARHPSWSGNGASLAIEIRSGDSTDIDTIPSTGVSDINSATSVTDLGNAENPSWSHTPGDNRIAFDAPCIEICTSIEVVDPATQDPVAVTSGRLPWYGTNGRIAFVAADGNIWSVNPDNTETLTPITAGGRDSAPSMVGNTVGFLRLLPSGQVCDVRVCTQIDIMLATLGGPQRAISFTATSTAPLKGELDYLCNGLTYPVQVGLTPSQISGTAQTFAAQFDGSDACGGGTLVARVTDGVQYSSGSPAPDVFGTLTVDHKPPTAAIYAPLDAFYGAGPSLATFPLNGTGYDAEGRTLPDASLHWTLTRPNGTVQDLGNFGSKDLSAPAGGWPAGTYTFTLVATDGDNVQSAPVTRMVHIGYIFAGGGFLPPIVNPAQVNSAAVGSTVPIKWQLTNADGSAVTDLEAVKSLQVATAATTLAGQCNFNSTTNPVDLKAPGSTALRASGNQYVYNWTTPSVAGCYVLQLTLSDGSEHDAWFKLS